VTAQPTPGHDLTHIDTWLFDLDNTLYPPEAEILALVEARMTEFVAREAGLPREEARALQHRYYLEHGTTLAGLMANHGVDPEAFLTEVHDIALDRLSPDPALEAALHRLPGRRLVFTNGDAGHAERVLAALGLSDAFEAVFHIGSAGYIPKPQMRCFELMVAEHTVTAPSAAFFEDSERNLEPAAALGMTTVLVGPHAAASTAPFVDHRAADLTAFLIAAQVRALRS
jgi:putative hydrolase of the HAD superfamily